MLSRKFKVGDIITVKDFYRNEEDILLFIAKIVKLNQEDGDYDIKYLYCTDHSILSRLSGHDKASYIGYIDYWSIRGLEEIGRLATKAEIILYAQTEI